MSKVEAGNSTMVSLIPEFYYDILARVLPGAFIGFVYGYLSPDQAANFGTISLAAFLCYFLGLTLEAVTDRLFLWAHCLCRRLTKHISFLKVEDDGTLWSWTRSLPAGEQIPLKKMFAEKILFRVLTFVSLLSAIFPPPVLRNNPHRIATSLAVSALFFFCYITLYHWISYVKHDHETRSGKA